jgi:SulP family sulfate permease
MLRKPVPSLVSFFQLFTPKLVTTLREGYGWPRFFKDALAGLTVAIVALPLAMGIAIASGAPPERGLFTAIIAGFLISLLGGSRYQIGGPTAAFIVVVYRTIEHHGYDGLALATLIAGFILLLIGFFRLGTYIKYIPYPVTIGFTAGIGITILVSQLADFLGLAADKLPGEFVPKVWALIHALPTYNNAAVVLAVGALALILFLQRTRPNWPRFLIAVIGASLAVTFLQLDVVTIGSKFGAIPSMLPEPLLPEITLERIKAVMPDAITIAILAAIESLLSAVVADGMTGRTHRSNMELVAQGFANIASPLFGGLPATGAIARTATNIRSGGTSPVAGMLHAAFLFLFIVAAAPLASYVPLAVLSAILVIVAWNMSEMHVVGNFLRYASTGDRVLLLSTLLLTVFYDLTLGIEVGVVLGAFKFMHNMTEAVQIESNISLIEEDQPDVVRQRRPHFDQPDLPKDVAIYRIHGPFFFGAAAELAKQMTSLRGDMRRLILDFSNVPLLDATGVASIKSIIRSARSKGIKVFIAGSNIRIRRSMIRYGMASQRPDFAVVASIEAALKQE